MEVKKPRKPKVAVRLDGSQERKKHLPDDNNKDLDNNNHTKMSQNSKSDNEHIEEAQYVDSNNGSNNQDEDADLKEFISPKKNKVKNKSDDNFNDIDQEALNEIEEFESQSGINDIPQNDFNPLEEAVKERSYTGGMVNSVPDNNNTQQQERIIEEPVHNISQSSNKLDVDDSLINPTTNPSNDIPNNDIPTGDGNGGNGGNGNNSNNTSGGGTGGDDKKEKKEKAGHDNVKELSPKEKRESVEKTADAILVAYKNYVPLPFIYFSSYNMKKLEKLDEEDEIDLQTKVRRDGTTFAQYAREFNQKVEETFSVNDEEVEQLREPLVDVLMEQEFAFTPTQRLMFVAGQFLVAKVVMCFKFLKEKKNDIEELKEVHRESMEALQKQYEQQERMNASKKQATADASNITVTNKTEVNQEAAKSEKQATKAESSNQKNTTGESDAIIISETNSNIIEETPTLEDVLEMPSVDDDDTNDNDIPE